MNDNQMQQILNEMRAIRMALGEILTHLRLKNK